MRNTFALLAVFSYIAVIGASPLGARAPAEAVGRRQLPPYCGDYPDAPGCGPTPDICYLNPELCDNSGGTPPDSGDAVVRRQLPPPPFCNFYPDAPGCEQAPSFCDLNPELCNNSGETPPASGDAVARRQLPPYCNDYPNAPGCEPITSFCDLNPELCDNSGENPPAPGDAAVRRQAPPYCDDYPNAPGCEEIPSFCDLNPELCETSGETPPGGSAPGDARAVVRRQYPYCNYHPHAPGCDGSDAPSCDEAPLQPSCVDICVTNPELSFCPKAPGPAPEAPARRQYPDCDKDPEAPGCGLDLCDVYPELCGPSDSK